MTAELLENSGLPRTTRVLCCLATRPGISRADLGEALANKAAMLQMRFGQKAQLLLAAAWADDPFADVGGDRHIESADAFLQINFPADTSDNTLVQAFRGLAAELGDLVDPAACSLSAGTALTLLKAQGDTFLAFVGRRCADMTNAQMSDYWLNHHAPLALSLMGPPICQYGYDQLHVDAESSARLSEAAGFPFVCYDMGDSIVIPDRERFLGVMAEPEIGSRLYEDECRFLDTTSWRGAFSDILYLTPDDGAE